MKWTSVVYAICLACLYVAGWLSLLMGDERPLVYLCCGFIGAVWMLDHEGRGK